MSAANWISMGISVLALFVSGATFWYLNMRRGSVRMTRPTMIGLGFRNPGGKNQVFLRAMLYATSRRGSVLENMYARISDGERSQNFSVWVLGETELMRRGAGLLVSENGVTKNFHFLLRNDEIDFELRPGKYRVRIMGNLLNHKREIEFSDESIEVTEAHLKSAGENAGIQFDWAPDSRGYIGFASSRLAGEQHTPPQANVTFKT